MNFREKYTTEAIKEAIINDNNLSEDIKDKERKKLVVSDEAYLNAEMQQSIVYGIEKLRLKL